ncbi:MAG TPA: hypothetical protein VLJ11_14660 [Bryobacteraceae bacterium]|nr:hypothetical protein [Bryobacteraceae bacterium]
MITKIRWVNRIAGKSCLQAALVLGLAMSVQTLHAQYPRPYGERRVGPVEVTIQHIEAIARVNGVYSHRERERYDNALRHLGQFEERARRGDFDKGKLDQAIGDVQNLVDHNPMDGRARDILWRDLGALRSLRERYDYGYGRY